MEGKILHHVSNVYLLKAAHSVFCSIFVKIISYKLHLHPLAIATACSHVVIFLLGFFTTTSAAATTTGFAGICLSDVLSSLAEKHNLGLIGVSRCKELRSDYRGVCRTDVSAATALRGTAPLIGRWEPGSCPS